MREGRKQEYVDYMKAQLRELVTKYDPAILWFDGEWVDWWTEEDGQDLYKYVRGLKPGILINNHRISDLHGRISDMERHLDQRFTSMEKLFDEKLTRVEQVMDARLTRIEQELKIR